jgi:hypothetical protein
MANTKIPSELSSTPSISDSGDATAITITSAEAVGIGTTSPTTAKVVISHAATEIGLHTTGGYNYQAKFESTDAEAAIVIEDSNSTNDGNRIGVVTNDLVFTTNNSERLRIDGTGSKMISTQGTTISSHWGTEFQGFQMADTHIAGYANTVLFMGGNNVWTDSGYKRLSTGYSSQLVVNSSGGLSFRTWGTGSAGDLGSPDYRFDVSHDGNITAPNNPAFDVSDSNGTTQGNTKAFGTVYVNKGSHYSTSNGRFTAPVAGTYLFYMSYIKNGSLSVHRRGFIKNGSTTDLFPNGRQLRLDADSSGGSQYGDNGYLIMMTTLAANDYIQVYQSAGNSYGAHEYEVFGGYLIG